MKKEIWTILGFGVAFLALVIAIIGLVISHNTARQIGENNQYLENTSENLKEVSTQLNEAELKRKMTWTLANLSDEAWPAYQKKYQEIAAISEPTYLEPTVAEGWMLTSEGKQLLIDTGIWDKAYDALAENLTLSINEVIIKLC